MKARESDCEKKNKTLKKWVLPIIISVICAAAGAFALLFFVPVFEGNVIRNADVYELDIKTMTGTDRHTMQLKEGDILQVQFETVKGTLHMEIKSPDGTVVYSGNGKETKSFSLKIQEDGVYTISVKARRAKGKIHVNLP